MTKNAIKYENENIGRGKNKMVIEQLIFTFISFAIFVYMFFRMIKNNDTSYVIILVLEAIGIALNFLEVLFSIKLNMVFVILKYVVAVLIPIVVVILEKRNIYLYESANITKAKIYMMLGNSKKAKQALMAILDKNPQSYKAQSRRPSGLRKTMS